MAGAVRGRPPAPAHHGAWNDWRPRFSPDGRSIAFLSDRDKEGVSQLLLLPLDGGDARPLTSFRRGVLEAEWMPDGRSLAVIATDDDSHVLHGERDGGETPTVRVLRRLDWRMDGDGLLDHPRHLHLVSTGGRSRRLTRGDWSATMVRPHPGGRSIGFLADRGPRATSDLERDQQVHVVELGSGRIRQRTRLPGEVLRVLVRRRRHAGVRRVRPQPTQLRGSLARSTASPATAPAPR